MSFLAVNALAAWPHCGARSTGDPGTLSGSPSTVARGTPAQGCLPLAPMKVEFAIAGEPRAVAVGDDGTLTVQGRRIGLVACASIEDASGQIVASVGAGGVVVVANHEHLSGVLHTEGSFTDQEGRTTVIDDEGGVWLSGDGPKNERTSLPARVTWGTSTGRRTAALLLVVVSVLSRH